jgi:hypothetical protein
MRYCLFARQPGESVVYLDTHTPSLGHPPDEYSFPVFEHVENICSVAFELPIETRNCAWLPLAGSQDLRVHVSMHAYVIVFDRPILGKLRQRKGVARQHMGFSRRRKNQSRARCDVIRALKIKRMRLSIFISVVHGRTLTDSMYPEPARERNNEGLDP